MTTFRKNGRNTPTVLEALSSGASGFGVNKERDARIAEVNEAISSTAFSIENMHIRALLTENQLIALTRLHMFAERYDSQTARDLLTYCLEISISRNGKSHEWAISIANAVLATEIEGGGNTFIKRVFGMGK